MSQALGVEHEFGSCAQDSMAGSERETGRRPMRKAVSLTMPVSESTDILSN